MKGHSPELPVVKGLNVIILYLCSSFLVKSGPSYTKDLRGRSLERTL